MVASAEDYALLMPRKSGCKIQKASKAFTVEQNELS